MFGFHVMWSGKLKRIDEKKAPAIRGLSEGNVAKPGVHSHYTKLHCVVKFADGRNCECKTPGS